MTMESRMSRGGRLLKSRPCRSPRWLWWWLAEERSPGDRERVGAIEEADHRRRSYEVIQLHECNTVQAQFEDAFEG